MVLRILLVFGDIGELTDALEVSFHVSEFPEVPFEPKRCVLNFW